MGHFIQFLSSKRLILLSFLPFSLLCFLLLACSQETTPPKTISSNEEVEAKEKEVEKEKTGETLLNEKKLPSYIVDSSHFRILPSDHHSSETPEKIALLTIDDAPRSLEINNQILETLKKHNITALWFLNGNQLVNEKGEILEDKAAFVRSLKENGHLIGNHSFSHRNLAFLSSEEVKEEIIKTNDIIEQITGERPRFFRHPFGSYTKESVQLVEEENMQHMNWSVGSLDWESNDPEFVKNQILTTIHPGANILIHDLPHSADMLPALLEELTVQGYYFVLPTSPTMEDGR
jgi:peptidoglycan-N-acetylglucosamine deacetylase